MGLPHTFLRRTALIALASLALASCSKPEPPNISFAPYAKGYQTKMDLAQVDYKYPIATAELAKITPDYLATLDEEQINQIYARLTAGQLGQPELAAAAARQQDAAFESAVGDRTGGQAGVDLIDLLLIQRRQIVGRDFRQLGRRNRILVLDLRQAHLRLIALGVRRKLDIRGFRLAARGKGKRGERRQRAKREARPPVSALGAQAAQGQGVR